MRQSDNGLRSMALVTEKASRFKDDPDIPRLQDRASLLEQFLLGE